jgi:hypothetical protein
MPTASIHRSSVVRREGAKACRVPRAGSVQTPPSVPAPASASGPAASRTLTARRDSASSDAATRAWEPVSTVERMVGTEKVHRGPLAASLPRGLDTGSCRKCLRPSAAAALGCATAPRRCSRSRSSPRGASRRSSSGPDRRVTERRRSAAERAQERGERAREQRLAAAGGANHEAAVITNTPTASGHDVRPETDFPEARPKLVRMAMR